MDQQNTEKIDKIIKDRQRAHEFLRARKSRTYEAFLKMEQATYSVGALDKKFKEMIAIGISIVVDCESCLQWHIREALNAGATKEQVLEAIEVGMEMGGGPATVTSRFAIDVLEYYTKNDKSEASC
jgi:AhpD family alkylhydroperoxidase